MFDRARSGINAGVGKNRTKCRKPRAGEAGTTAAPCAIVNAIANALPAQVAAAIQMPVTAQAIWRALHAPRAAV